MVVESIFVVVVVFFTLVNYTFINFYLVGLIKATLDKFISLSRIFLIQWHQMWCVFIDVELYK